MKMGKVQEQVLWRLSDYFSRKLDGLAGRCNITAIVWLVVTASIIKGRSFFKFGIRCEIMLNPKLCIHLFQKSINIFSGSPVLFLVEIKNRNPV